VHTEIEIIVDSSYTDELIHDLQRLEAVITSPSCARLRSNRRATC